VSDDEKAEWFKNWTRDSGGLHEGQKIPAEYPKQEEDGRQTFRQNKSPMYSVFIQEIERGSDFSERKNGGWQLAAGSGDGSHTQGLHLYVCRARMWARGY
jgi:hypothetical protein